MNQILLSLAALLLSGAVAAGGGDDHQPVVTTRHDPETADAAALPKISAPALPAHITLTGVASLGSKRWALLSIQPAGQPVVAVALREGETEAAVQVLEIDMIQARTTVRNAGKTEILSLHGLAVVNAAAPDAGHAPLATLPAAESGER